MHNVTLTLSAGKSYFLWFILFLRLTANKTTLYQTENKLFLFEAGKPARNITKVPRLQGDDIWALVDGDAHDGQPHPDFIDMPNVRIVMASSPKTGRGDYWLKQKVGGVARRYMKTWTENELLVVGCVLFCSSC
jgi:hypothetical protein